MEIIGAVTLAMLRIGLVECGLVECGLAEFGLAEFAPTVVVGSFLIVYCTRCALILLVDQFRNGGISSA